MIMIRYVLQNKHINKIEYKVYSLKQIEHLGLSALFPVHDYDIISRDRFTGLTDKNGKKAFKDDKVNHPAYGEGVINWDVPLACFFIDFGGDDFDVNMRELKKCELTGNIHDKN